MANRYLVALAVVGIAACGNTVDERAEPGDGGVSEGGGRQDVAVPADQHILFEVSRGYSFWGDQALDGVFVTSDGGVYAYDYFASAGPDAGWPEVQLPASEAELRTRYGNSPERIASIPAGELLGHFAGLLDAASGVVLTQSVCADAGTLRFLGYRYDPDTALYSSVLLEQRGSMAAKNLSPQAAALVEWLAGLGDFATHCRFEGATCTGQGYCPEPSPRCGAGEVPSVVDGCWGACVRVDQCLEVSDCSVCSSAGSVCVTSVTGSAHCVAPCPVGDACSCPSAPACAGGADSCRSTSSGQVECLADG